MTTQFTWVYLLRAKSDVHVFLDLFSFMEINLV